MSIINNYSFLTSNIKKAEDFKKYGFGVKEFKEEIKEVQCPHSDVISMYKANDTGLNNIMVEDTGLYVEGAPFCGSEIKYVYEHIKDDDSYHGREARWVVAICLKTPTHFYVAQGITDGVLNYPAKDYGYHFERIFAVDVNGEKKVFSDLTDEERDVYNPRFKALRVLKEALETNDFSRVFTVKKSSLPEWRGSYQEDNLPVKPQRKFKP